MKESDTDFSGRIGDLFGPREEPEWPMYSYSRPAWMFWNGFANGLLAKGLTEEQVKDQLQSKGMRWMLDSDDQIEELGRKMAQEYEPIEL